MAKFTHLPSIGHSHIRCKIIAYPTSPITKRWFKKCQQLLMRNLNKPYLIAFLLFSLRGISNLMRSLLPDKIWQCLSVFGIIFRLYSLNHNTLLRAYHNWKQFWIILLYMYFVCCLCGNSTNAPVPYIPITPRR